MRTKGLGSARRDCHKGLATFSNVNTPSANETWQPAFSALSSRSCSFVPGIAVANAGRRRLLAFRAVAN
jgi:hypothetical protein